MTSEWVEWHRQYAPGEPLSLRLEVVQRLLRTALDTAPRGRLRLISMCAGDGRDVLGVLPTHPRRTDVVARLVELDPELAGAAREGAAAAGLTDVHLELGDAATTDAYDGAVPADIALVCGVFGNVSDADVERTVRMLPSLCAPQAAVIWTRGTFAPDLTPRIREWFADSGFEEMDFVAIPGTTVGVGAHRLRDEPRSFVPGQRMFTFLDTEARPAEIARRRAQSGSSDTAG